MLFNVSFILGSFAEKLLGSSDKSESMTIKLKCEILNRMLDPLPDFIDIVFWPFDVPEFLIGRMHSSWLKTDKTQLQLRLQDAVFFSKRTGDHEGLTRHGYSSVPFGARRASAKLDVKTIAYFDICENQPSYNTYSISTAFKEDEEQNTIVFKLKNNPDVLIGKLPMHFFKAPGLRCLVLRDVAICEDSFDKVKKNGYTKSCRLWKKELLVRTNGFEKIETLEIWKRDRHG